MHHIRIAIVEDEAKARENLAVLFAHTPDFQCVSTHHSAEDALEHLPYHNCDVVLMDLRLPGVSGIDCTRELKRRRPALQILVLTVCEDWDLIFESLKAGASGYLLKNTPFAQLVVSVQDIHAGGSLMSPAIARQITESFHAPATATGGLALLTDRERAILDHIARGRLNKEIALLLGIAEVTVENHLRHIYEKLHVRNRTEAAAKFRSR